MEPVHQPGRRVVLTPRSEQLCATAGVAPELLRAAALESSVKPGAAASIDPAASPTGADARPSSAGGS